MASLQPYPNGIFHVHFRYAGQRFNRSLKTCDPVEAQSRVARLRETLKLVEAGRIEVPLDEDPGSFLLADGRATKSVTLSEVRTLSELFCAYDDQLPEGAKEASTIIGELLHRRHLLRILKGRLRLTAIKYLSLQEYANRRLAEKHRGEPIRPATIRKEITTLRLVWNWALEAEYVAKPLPTRKLIYPKVDEKPPFMTWNQIEAAVSRRVSNARDEKRFWESLYLRRNEIDEFLDHAEGVANEETAYPLLVAVAHTGARRSELMRSQVEDFDLSRKVLTIREKKKSRQKAVTYRHVPMSERLHRAMSRWYAVHPSSSHTFCARNGDPLTSWTIRKAYDRAVMGSRWKHVRGFHVFRHSFASNLASGGVDQRIIDEWMGHQTEEMRRRYRHLFPDQQRAALESVFGSPNSKQPFAATIPIGA